ncbi:MAG TPA: NAD(P)(+) transhydrogenase (Re/Si-specific) subunit beta [Planctomycetaceae bacterium]|nr:NAD(P)(+) transhydrogenase (Re/Si-specific) subunit beta [Planctomycetaceae bacterium]HIQ22269.1 NAD(P)(+) transhydrogenase (Re/Si-specific) subunit beta [Planctomycetota bacterium]
MSTLILLAYLLAAVLFILGLKGLTHPRTAVRGNLLGATGMLLAVVATLVHQEVVSYQLILVGIVIGAAAGTLLALKIQMTAMPQMVALLNGFGGGASVLVAGAELVRRSPPAWSNQAVAVTASGLIGAVTFWGSLVAFGKLQELGFFRRPLEYPFRQPGNALLALAAVALAAWGAAAPQSPALYLALVLVASILGLTLVNPIGGADMPVVIALLNSYSGLAAAATGFVLGNTVLIISGALVGASGLILTSIMCRAMNRSLAHVLFGVLGPAEEGATADETYGGRIKATTAEEVAMLYDGARRAVIVPGYGMAVAQAQHAVRELAETLQSRGIEVEFGIHPVAGRMPGHMNVLLAEAEVSYEQLKEMDQINPTFPQTDVVLVIGANDVVNPVARTDPSSPIAGMPILDVDKARTVVVIKRSLSPGFAGIPNPLFAADNCLMYFGDGKKAVLDLVAALKEQ